MDNMNGQNREAELGLCNGRLTMLRKDDDIRDGTAIMPQAHESPRRPSSHISVSHHVVRLSPQQYKLLDPSTCE
jgi:hypothetical protein